MLREEKHDLVARMHAALKETQGIVVAHYQGMTVAEMDTLRTRMRDAGASVRVTKNKLTQIALRETPFQDLQRLFKGPTIMTTSRDPVGMAKATLDYAKTNQKFVILGGALPGQVIDLAGVEALSKMPSIDELRAKILGVLVAPATRIVSILPQPATKLVRQLNAPAQNVVGVFRAYGMKDAA